MENVASTSIPPPATETVKRGRRLTSASNTSVGGKALSKKPTPDEVQEQESSASEPDIKSKEKENANADMMAELNVAATREYPHIPAVKNSPLIIKIHEVLRQDVLEKLSVRYRFGNINPAVWKITDKRFRRELSRNEAHSYAYLM